MELIAIQIGIVLDALARPFHGLWYRGGESGCGDWNSGFYARSKIASGVSGRGGRVLSV